jgi:putative phosphoesterase
MLNEAAPDRYQPARRGSLRVGLISDTHGLLRPKALDAVRGAVHLVHAGDIGTPEVLDALRALAPLTAVRGNNDRGAWARAVPETGVVQVGGVRLYVLHDLKALEIDPAAAGFRVVVSGHSHQPRVEERDGVLFVNPGSAGPRRFRLPVSVAVLEIRGSDARARIQPLDV